MFLCIVVAVHVRFYFDRIAYFGADGRLAVREADAVCDRARTGCGEVDNPLDMVLNHVLCARVRACSTSKTLAPRSHLPCVGDGQVQLVIWTLATQPLPSPRRHTHPVTLTGFQLREKEQQHVHA